MANKKINELDVRSSLSLSDLMAVGDPSTGYLYKTTISDLKTLTGAGVISFNTRFGAVMPAEGDYNLTQLGDVIITSPTANQVLQFNGSNWVNVAAADLSGFVPYTGATSNVNLGTYDLSADIINVNEIKALTSGGVNIYSNSGTHIALMGAGGGAGTTLYGGLIGTTGSFSSSGSGNTLDITHSSGSGIALNITKSGNGEGLYINKTSGSGNAATIIGTLNATTLVKSGGTSSQFLKADGSVDGNTYALVSDLNGYVNLTTNQSIGGIKTFTTTVDAAQLRFSESGGFGQRSGYTQIGGTADYFNFINGNNTRQAQFNYATTGSGRVYTLPSESGTLALTSALSGYLPLTAGSGQPLSGTLFGTSASFTGNGAFGTSTTNAITLNANTGNPNIEINGGSGSASVGASAYLRLRDATNSRSVFQQINVDGGLDYWFQYSGTFNKNISFTKEGGASFSNPLNGTSLSMSGGANLATSSGNVGIGTTTPLATLHVLANSTVNEGNAAAIIRQGGGNNNNGLLVDVTNTVNAYIADFRQANSSLMRLTGDGTFLINTTTTDGTNKLIVNGSGKFTGQNIGDVALTVTSLWGSSSNKLISASNSSSEVFRVQRSGYTSLLEGINVRARDNDDLPFINFSNNDESFNWARIGGDLEGSGDASFYLQTKTGAGLTTKLTISSTGSATFSSSVTATGFFESSDSRYKSLIADRYNVPGIEAITPKLYKKNGKTELGYFAQDFIGVLDSAITKSNEGMLSLSYREVLVAKIYALEREIEKLKNK